VRTDRRVVRAVRVARHEVRPARVRLDVGATERSHARPSGIHPIVRGTSPRRAPRPLAPMGRRAARAGVARGQGRRDERGQAIRGQASRRAERSPLPGSRRSRDTSPGVSPRSRVCDRPRGRLRAWLPMGEDRRIAGRPAPAGAGFGFFLGCGGGPAGRAETV
jgi:hypothetical protein